jgi:hypothetical protein
LERLPREGALEAARRDERVVLISEVMALKTGSGRWSDDGKKIIEKKTF